MTDATVCAAHTHGYCTPGPPDLSCALGCVGAYADDASRRWNGDAGVVPIPRSEPASQPRSSVQTPRRRKSWALDRFGGHPCAS